MNDNNCFRFIFTSNNFYKEPKFNEKIYSKTGYKQFKFIHCNSLNTLRTKKNCKLYLSYNFFNGKDMKKHAEEVKNNREKLNRKKHIILLDNINPLSEKEMKCIAENKKYRVSEDSCIHDKDKLSDKNKDLNIFNVTSKFNSFYSANKSKIENSAQFPFFGSIKTILNSNSSPSLILKKNNIKNYFDNNVTETIFDKRKNFDFPNFYDTVFLCLNKYASKSEKERHENLIQKLMKLKWIIERIKEDRKKKIIIKDFLSKYKIGMDNEIPPLAYFKMEKFLKNDIFKLNPYKNSKEMIKDIIYNYDNSKTNKKSTIKQSDNDMLKYMLKSNYSSPNIRNSYDIKNKWRKEYFGKSCQKLKNTSYKNLINSKHELNKKCDNLTMNLYMQKKILTSMKDYSNNYKLLIKDLEKEINDIKYNYYNNLKITDNKFIPKKDKYKKKLQFFLTSINRNTKSNKKKEIKQYNLKEINKRFYYSRINHEFSFSDIEKQNKITEFITLNSIKNIMKQNEI